MIERFIPNPETHITKYDSPRDEVLDKMTKEGWANQVDGNVECIATGWFARISTTEHEFDEVHRAFEEQIAEAGLIDPSELIGHFLLEENHRGEVRVTRYEDEDTLLKEYELHEFWYSNWLRNIYSE